MSVYNGRVAGVERRGDLWLLQMEFEARPGYVLCLTTRVLSILYARITRRSFGADFLEGGCAIVAGHLSGRDVYSPGAAAAQKAH